MSKYEFDLSVGIKEVLDADAAQKVESQMEAQRARFEEPIEIKLNVTDAKKRFKELEKEAKKVKKSLDKALSSKDFDGISRYTKQMSNVQREQKELLSIIGEQTKEIAHQADVIKTTDAAERRRQKATQGITAATEDMVEVLQEQAKAIREVEKAEVRLQKTRQKTQKADTTPRPVGKKAQEVEGAYQTLGEVIEQTRNEILGTDFDKIFNTRTIEGYTASLEKVRNKMTEIKDEARDAKQVFADLNDTINAYTGSRLGNKSAFQKAIKDAWNDGDRPMAAKLFASYQDKFPDGKYDPAKQFGSDWTDNFSKNLEEANRSLSVFRTQLKKAAVEYGTYSALVSLQTMEKELIAGYDRMLQEKVEAERAAVLSATMLADAQKRFATKDITTAQINLNSAIDEYNAKVTDAIRLLEEKRRLEDLDSYENEPWYNDYEFPVNKIVEISQQFAEAEDAADLFKISLKEAVRVYRELGGDMKLPFSEELLKEIDIPVRVVSTIDTQINAPKVNVTNEEELEIIQKENGALEDKLELLQEIAEQYANNVSLRDRNRFEELNQKDMNDGLTSREEERYWELGEAIDEADRQLEEFGQTYARIVLKLENGKKIEILPDDAGLKKFDKIASEYYQGEYNGIQIEDVIFERIQQTTSALEAQTVATEKLAEARLKLTPKKEGGYTVPETYVAEDGKFEVSKGSSGWDVYQRDNAGMYNLIATYKHLDDVRKDSSLLAREEIVYTDEMVEGLHTLQEAYRALGHQMQGRKPVVDTYLDLLIQIKSGALSAADAVKQFNGVVGNTQPKQQSVSSDDALVRTNVLNDFTQSSRELVGQYIDTEQYDAVINKVEEIATGILYTGTSLEEANKQLNQFVAGLTKASNVSKTVSLDMDKTNLEKEAKDLKYLVSNHQAWIDYLDKALDKDRFKTSGKREATEQLKTLTKSLTRHSSENYENYNGQYAEQMLTVSWMHGYQEAQRQNVAASTLSRNRLPMAEFDYDRYFAELQEERDRRVEQLKQDSAKLQAIQAQIASHNSPAVGTLDHLVDSLLKLESINAEPLNKLVESIVNGEQTISSEVQAILQSLNLLNNEGTFTGKYITEGMNNSGVVANDKYAIIARSQDVYDQYDDYDFDFKDGTTYIDNLIAKEEEAAAKGVNLARVLDVVQVKLSSGGNLYYEIQEFAPGEQLHIFDASKQTLQEFEQECKRIVGATDEQIQKLMSDLVALNDQGLFLDLSPANILYDTAKGFTLIDLEVRDLGTDAQTATELMEGLYVCLTDFDKNSSKLSAGMNDADKWGSSMASVYQRLNKAFSQNNFGVNIDDISSAFNDDFRRYITPSETVQPQIVQQTTMQIEAQAEAEQNVTEAVQETTDALKEQKEVVEEIAKTESKLGKQAFRGLGLNEFFKKWQIPTKDRDPIKQELYRLAEMYSADKITSEVDAQHIEQYPEQYNKVINMLLDSLQANKAQSEEYKEFLDWMSGQNVAYDPNDREYAAAFDKAWGTIRQKHSSWLVSSEKNTTASGPDTFFESIPEKFLHLFNEQEYNLMNTYDILRALVDVIDVARTEQTMMDVDGLEQTKMSLAEHFATDLFLPMIDKVDTIIDTSEDEAIRIIQKTVDQALTQLRNAHNNKNAMIDLSEVSSPGDLEEQIGGLVTKSLNADLTVGAVNVQDNIAQISLYNKELGLTQQQTWALERSTEDAMEAQLKFIKADPLKVNFEQAAKYAEAQQKKIDDSAKWLISAQKKLDTQKRDYQHSQKKIDGSTELLNLDVTTLEKDADKTIDGLVEHIQKRINDSAGKLTTNELKNQITRDLNALENEIKIRQLEKYTSTTMSASEAEAARKVIVDTIDTIAANAKKKNIFDSIRESYEQLRARLTDSSVQGYIKDNFTDAINEMRVLRADSSKASAEEGNLSKILALQEKLYEAKKKIAELDTKGQLYESDGMKATRKAADLQAEYDTSVKLLENEKQREAVKHREAQLESELNQFNLEQEKIKRQEVEAEQISSVKSQYQTILDLVNKINTANERMIKFQSMDGGSGVLRQQIQAEVEKKAESVEKLQTVMSELNIGNVLGQDQYSVPDDIKSIGADYSQISAFINDAGVQASLTTAEIEKLVNALVKAGDIDLSMLDEALNMGNLKEKAKQTVYENNYFADKTKFADNLGIDDIQKLGTIGSTTKEKLEGLAQAIAQNSNGAVALTKNFTQGADGIAKLDFSVFDQNTNSLRDFTVALGTMTGQVGVYETTINKSLANMQAANKQLQSTGSLLGTLGASGVDTTDSGAPAQVQKLLNLYKQLSAEMTKGDQADQNKIVQLTKDLKLASGETDKLYKQMVQLDDAIDSGKMRDMGKGDPTGNVYDQLVTKAQELGKSYQGAVVETGRFDASTNSLNVSVVQANGAVENFKLSMNGLNGQMAAQQTGVSKLTSTWDSFKASIGKAGKQLMTAFAGYNVFYKAISEVRKGVGYVKEIDLALTELKKVTDETEASYAAFLKTAASTAGEIGSTVSDFTEATSNFARLGYTMEESANMAETAIVYRNVADGLDTVEEATDSIISTMKAFGIESDNTIGIIDVFNEVGNNFAITSAGIGEAMQRSASALYEAGNTFEESTALITAANSVIQNPEQVGTALKTLALRLRGAKVELEEAGLETDSMAESTSTLQAKLNALTHGKVDIMLDADTFKSTTQILREMSDVWEEMTDIEQASALELMGGKRQANILSSLISNFETVEDVIETSMNSSGSAMAENAKWMDSIEGKSQQLANSMQALWNDTLNSEVIKYFYEVAQGVTEAVHAFGPWKTALAAVMTYFVAFKKITPKALFSDLATNVKSYATAMQEVAHIKSLGLGLTESGALNASSVVAYANALQGMSAQQQAAILTSQGLEKAHIAQVLAQNGVEEATIRQIAGQEALNASKAKAISMTGAEMSAQWAQQGVKLSDAAATWLQEQATEELTREKILNAAASGALQGATMADITALLGLVGATGAATTGIKGLTAAMWAMMKSNPVGWILTLIGAVATLAPLFDDVFKSAEEKMQDLESEWKTLSDTINTSINDFKSLKSSADDVIPRFVELAEGVDQFGNNVKLTDAEYKEFLSLNNQIAEMFPELNNGMDENGNAMLSLSFTANTLEDSLWSLVEAERAAANEEIAKTMPDVLDNIKGTVGQYDKQIENTKKELENLKEYYNKILNGEEINVIGHKNKNDVRRVLDSLGAQYTATEAGMSFAPNYTFHVNQSNIDEITRNYENAMAGLGKEVQNINEKIANKWAQLNPVLTAWTQTDYTYQGLSDEMQKVVQGMMGNIDFSKLNTAEKIQNHIKNNIINKIDALTPVAQQKFAKLMSLDSDELSTQAYIDEINKISQEIEDMNIGWSASDIKEKTGYDEIIQQYNDIADEMVDILGEGFDESSEEFNKLKENLYSLSPDKLTKAFDIIKKYGIKTWDELAEAIENKTFDVVLNYDEEQEGIESLMKAIDESTSAVGLSAESIEALQGRYQDLENYDPARLFEETTNGIHLNTKALWELEEAYREQKKTDLDKKLKDLTEQYDDLTMEIQDCSDASERAQLYSQRQEVLDQINDTATLAARYEGLISAYNKWQQITAGGSERDMYEGVLEGREEMDEEMSRGWVDDGTRAYLEMLSGQDLSTAPYEKVLEVYKKMNEAINGAGYSVYDFFTQDEDGNSTTDGIFNFFDAVKVAQKEVGANWVKVNEQGQYMFDFGEGGDKAVAEALGISEELVQIILRAAKDAGFEVNLDSVYTQLADFEDEVGAVNERLKELGATEYTFNINSTDLDDINTQITEAEKALINLKNEDGTLKIGVSQDDYENAQTLLATLIYQRQTLEKPAILGVKVTLEDAEEGIETVIAKLIDFKAKYNELEVKTAIGADTTEAKKNLDAAITALNQEEKEILTSLGIDTTKTSEEINAAIANITPQMMVDCGLNTTLVEEYQAAEHTTTGEVVWDNNIDAVTEWMAQAHEVDGTVKWDDDTTDLTTYYTGKGVIYWDEGGAVVDGTAHVAGTAFAGGNRGAPKTETALVGELGPEMLVRNGRWTTIGENGAEFRQIKKGDIIFNHKQTQDLLSKGYITSRGKAYVGGTAYSDTDGTYGPGRHTIVSAYVDGGGADRLDDAADKLSDAADDFKESIDWIEIRIEELNERLSLKAAKLENAVGAKAQNKIIDSMIADNQMLYDNLIAGANEYYSHAKTLLGKIPAQFRDAAKNGSIAITEFAGKTSEEAYNAIQEYREWVQKGADLTQQSEEVITEIRSLAVQAFDNIAAQYDGENSITEAKNAKLEAAMNRAEERGRPISEAYYLEMAVNTGDLMTQKKDERKDLQSKLNKQVRNDEIEVGGKDYNKMVAQILELDAEIIDLETDIESYQNAINDLHWDNFDTQIERLQNISDETQEVIDLLSEKDLFNETGEWTDEGIASIGLYGQQMENAKLQAAMYADAMATLTQEYENGLYSESEYADQMAELKKGHYGAIKSYNDAEDAIIDMNKARVEAIKEGIDKEIEAYDKLIEKKKEELDSEKDLHDFRKRSQETTKNIADIERQLAALAGDNSMAAQAKRARLEAELAEARTEQDEMYYERSVANQQEALDKSRENFTAEKEAEKEELETQLEDTKAVVAEAFKSLEENAAGVHTTLTTLAGEYGLQLSDAIVNPWKDGATTMGTYWKTFTDTGSDAITGLTTQLDTFYKSLDVAEKRANAVIEAQNKKNQKTMEEKNPKKPAQTGNGNGNGNGNVGGKTNNPPKAGATVTVKKSATHFGPQSGSKKMASFVPGGKYTVYETMGTGKNAQVLIGKNGAYTGWVKLTDLQGYAKGTTGVDKDQLAWIDELGEELVLQADGNGRLKYLTKGSSVVPHDITENLMSWGALDPSNMLEQNRPSIGVSPEVHNTEINLDCSVGTLVNIEHCDQGTLPDVEKMVNKAFEKHMQNLNNNIKRYTR